VKGRSSGHSSCCHLAPVARPGQGGTMDVFSMSDVNPYLMCSSKLQELRVCSTAHKLQAAKGHVCNFLILAPTDQ
jgi:hypothetical protein